MKLKSIRIFGFKSFADKTILEFNSSITAIVGPNGSGKSNIVDAIRWVLGEQSIKSLRGGEYMADVIFAGSETRAPFKRAEVALQFDNTEQYLNSELNDIEVKRVLYYTGENEYYINNVKVRLKDIHELFLDSGIGEDSFNIISQGKIESIINSKPQDRRVILESAAQVLKYKTRKQESIKKLEKTEDNLEKVGLVIHELKDRVEPLKEQSQAAQQYLEFQKELQDLEIALTTRDITSINQEYQNIQKKIEEFTTQKEKLEKENTTDTTALEKKKLELIKLEEEITMYQEQTMTYHDMITKLNSEKQVILERQKYEVNAKKIDENLLTLKEEELDLLKQQETMKQEQSEMEAKQKELKGKKTEIEEEESLLKIKYNHLRQDLLSTQTNLANLQNKAQILKQNIENNESMPYAVKNVLNNPRLKGIHNTIGRLIEVEEKYQDAIEVALGASSNFIVVENEKSARDAITYLKENKLGRATFFPLSIISSRYVSPSILSNVKQMKGVLGIASDFIKCDGMYQNIIENQLGNIFVVETMKDMESLGKETNYKYRIVSLDGELSNIGGSLTGGSRNRQNKALLEKHELEETQKRIEDARTRMKSYEEQEEEYRTTLDQKREEIAELDKNMAITEQLIKQKETYIKEQELKIQSVQKEISGANALKEGSLEESIIAITKKVKEAQVEQNQSERKLSDLKVKKSDLSSEIAQLENLYRNQNSKVHSIEQELKKQEIELGKMDTKMDYLLNLLSESYHMTYEHAKNNYFLEIEPELARLKVNTLKKQIKDLGQVNLTSIEEYKKVSERYEFLTSQEQDLQKSIEDLNSMIEEMDSIMIERLKSAFDKIQEQFSIIFKKLFKGGKGILKLTDETNILESGIEIIAEPPGKKLNSIQLLSGGEKTLTAIALLFSILNVYPVPFCVLDEVEAALDEANVDTFGSYLQEQEEKSEFILITHKKRTMEYAGTLYGITMQEQGVSKVVSVRLEDHNEE